MLNRRFFERIATHDDKDSVLESYKAVYARSTMVLFSRKTHSPLAALTLQADDVGCLSMLTGRPSPKGSSETYFQGMLNMPDQTFSFTITNLSDEGMINFNILHTPHWVSEVNPGPSYGINEVNELRANESYTIPADQRNNRKMILKGKTKTIQDPETSMEKQVAVTVKESEARDKPTGLYFYLSVVPDVRSSSLVDKFAETVWKVVPGFVRRVAKPPEPIRHFPGSTSPIMNPSTGIPSVCHLMYGASQPQLRQTCGIGSRLPHRPPPHRHAVRGRRLSLEEQPREAVFLASDSEFDSFRARGASAEMLSSNMGDYATTVDVGSTQATELTYGKRVKVSSRETGHNYDYDHCSEPTVLCMSIWEDMKFLPLSHTIEDELAAEVKELLENKGKALIESLNSIYKSDTCVIDMESEADTIVCTCGHQCLNHVNVGRLVRCPMCRKPITAFVRADGIIME